MKYHELPKKYQAEALRRVAGAWNEMYEEQGLPSVDEDAPEVIELAQDRDYEIERGQYEPGVGYELLVIL